MNHSWLQIQLQKNPKGLFIQEGGVHYSFEDVGGIVSVLSHALLQEGIQPQDKIVIYLNGGVKVVELILACLEIGVVAVPVSVKFRNSELEKIFNIIQPRLIITSWEKKSQVSSFKFQVSNIEQFTNSGSECSSPIINYRQKPDDIAAIILTSGTTGIPKAVQLSYGNFEASCNNWNTFLQFRSNDQFLCCLSIHHIGGLAVLLRALLFNFSVNLVNDFDAQVVLDTIKHYPITIISLVPTMLKRILKLDGGLEELIKLRWILLGGGPSPEYLLDYCIAEELNIVKVYGMTETCSGTVGLKLLEEPQNKLYAGRPFSGAKVWTENDEFQISGPMVMHGYVGEPETNSIHNTQDLGWIDENGLVYLDMRRKDLIVSGGENVNPIEVEEALMNISGVTDAAVVGVDDEEWGQKVVAYIVLNDKSQLTNDAIKETLEEIFTIYKIPKKFIQVPSIPRNELGKIEYEKLRANLITLN